MYPDSSDALKKLEYVDKAIRISPREPILGYWYDLKAQDYLGLKQYDQAIEWARRAIALGPNYAAAHRDLNAALALSGHEAEAREALQRFLALPPGGPGESGRCGGEGVPDSAYRPHTDPAVLDSLTGESRACASGAARRVKQVLKTACGSGCDARRLSTAGLSALGAQLCVRQMQAMRTVASRAARHRHWQPVEDDRQASV